MRQLLSFFSYESLEEPAILPQRARGTSSWTEVRAIHQNGLEFSGLHEMCCESKQSRNWLNPYQFFRIFNFYDMSIAMN
jgi:hypothetical protein